MKKTMTLKRKVFLVSCRVCDVRQIKDTLKEFLSDTWKTVVSANDSTIDFNFGMHRDKLGSLLVDDKLFVSFNTNFREKKLNMAEEFLQVMQLP